ncbi:hypothetical protein OJAV_G00012160 [Oryzias javanicus]|uniref:Immunoglobulin V-set domain-containing protein n=1 Tax=Oryzias javanicus TaxID=123683 RepID=A0A3S2URL7_ORYJA|nr:hypothetical protein OJAV_G00012160 [Oryzias javanicus]
MLLLLGLLSAAGFGLCSGILQQVALLRSVAVLSCPHAGPDVTWSRVRNGERLVLVSVRAGRETRLDRRFGSQADGSLVITNTEASDETVYFCNQQPRVYLKVTSDPQEVPSKAPPEPGPQRSLEEDSGGEEGSARVSSDWWKVPAGVLAGASLVLLSIFILRFCSARRADEAHGKDPTGSEVVYEEIRLDRSSEVPLYDHAPNLQETRTKENDIYSSA